MYQFLNRLFGKPEAVKNFGKAKGRSVCLIWPASAPSRLSGIGGVKGHNRNENFLPGKPRPYMGGELQIKHFERRKAMDFKLSEREELLRKTMR